MLNMIPKAKQTFSKLLETNPHDFETWNNYASFLLRNNFTKMAVNSL